MADGLGKEARAFEPWSVCSTSPGEIDNPGQFGDATLAWIADAPVPGTAAEALRRAGQWDFGTPLDFDARDWWYRTRLALRESQTGTRTLLRFGGLATLAQVWLNRQPILISENMFHAHVVDITDLIGAENELVICFRSVSRALEQRRARPRWKTKLVRQQQLRWIRTALLGRIPAWSPPVAPVGPWRGITLEAASETTVTDIDACPSVSDGSAVLDFSARIPIARADGIKARLVLAGTSHEVSVQPGDDGCRLSCHIDRTDLALWWPHTHGNPALHECEIRISVEGREITVSLGRLGFKHVRANEGNGDFAVQINGQRIFCRGACWTTSDIVALHGSNETLEQSLQLAQNAGMNMVRVGGTMVYEQDEFYRLCDELGIMVWQDFMFANMDYPDGDPSFSASVETEVVQQLRRLRKHACMTVYCGNSEVEQQAAMLGMPRDQWRNELFGSFLPRLCQRWHPGIPYVPSTPSGGAMPFHVGTGLTHYYGVGAYLRPVAQVRRDNVRFTAECLGFSNVPDAGTVNGLFGGEAPATHHPIWKERVPRDAGAGWDFEDVRDHYLKELFGVDPVRLRSADTQRYLALSRVTTGELMNQVFSEWRNPQSRCGGALVWFFRDLWPGAGWGIVDSLGNPKACYYYLRRTWQSRQLLLTNEGLDGVRAHVINERDEPLLATLKIVLLRGGHIVTGETQTDVCVPPRSGRSFDSDQLFDAFQDVTYAYRFGPPKHDLVAATLLDPEGAVLGESFLFPESGQPVQAKAEDVVATSQHLDKTTCRVDITSSRFLYAAHLDIRGFLPDDNYFHVLPGQPKSIQCRRLSGDSGGFRGYLEAQNVSEPVRIDVVGIR